MKGDGRGCGVVGGMSARVSLIRPRAPRRRGRWSRCAMAGRRPQTSAGPASPPRDMEPDRADMPEREAPRRRHPAQSSSSSRRNRWPPARLGACAARDQGTGAGLPRSSCPILSRKRAVAAVVERRGGRRVGSGTSPRHAMRRLPGSRFHRCSPSAGSSARRPCRERSCVGRRATSAQDAGLRQGLRPPERTMTLVPVEGLEPPTPSLRMTCSTC